MEDWKSFVFYPTWRTTLEGFEQRLGADFAKELLWNIMTKGTGDDYKTDDQFIQSIIDGMIAPNIAAAQKRYENCVESGKFGGRPRKEIDIEAAKKMRESGMSYERIGKELGVGKDTIRRRLNENFGANCSLAQKEEKDKYLDKEKEIEIALIVNGKEEGGISDTTIQIVANQFSLNQQDIEEVFRKNEERILNEIFK